MSTPVWKKRFILIFGLFENLIFSGTILGWSSLNYMLKSEGVYHYICDEKSDIQYKRIDFNKTEVIEKMFKLNKHKEEDTNQVLKKLNDLNKKFIDFMISESSINGTNLTVLEQLEAYRIEPSLSSIDKSQGCGAQDKILNLAFTVGSFCMGFSAFIWGFLLEKWGLKIVRLLISCLITGGATLLSFTSDERPLLIFPAVILLSLGGVPLRIANMQFANLYPSRRSTIISLYSGAFCASAVVFVFLKYFFDFGISYMMVTLLLALTSLLMFPFTLFVLPKDRIREESDFIESKEPKEKTKSMFTRNAFRSSLMFLKPKVTLEKFTLISSPYFNRKSYDFEKQNEKQMKTIIKDNINEKNNDFNHKNNLIFWVKSQSNPITSVNTPNKSVKKGLPLRISLRSLAFNLHQWWFSWLITYMIMYVGSLNLWLQRVTDDIRIANSISKIYGASQILGLFLAPIAGLLMDISIQKTEKETDPFQKKLKIVRSGFWPLFITTLLLSVCLFCRFFDNETAVYISIVFMTIFRSFLVAVGTAYLRIRFNGEHFNRLLGIMSTIASIVSLLQFPLFIWESQYPSNAFWVNIFNCTCTFIAFANPIYILITPLQRYILLKEEKEEADAKNQ